MIAYTVALAQHTEALERCPNADMECDAQRSDSSAGKSAQKLRGSEHNGDCNRNGNCRSSNDNDDTDSDDDSDM